MGASPEVFDTPAPGVPLVLVPGWAELRWLVHGFSTRAGGVSAAYPGDEAGGALNLGFTAADDPRNVQANRERLLRRLLSEPAPEPLRLVTLRQTHSDVIHRVGPADAQALDLPAVREGDGLMTNEPGVLLGIQTADCVPVLVVDPARRAVAAFHAGWRGTVTGIVEAGVARMEAEFGSRAGELLAAVGSSIGPCCYTVGEDLRKRFLNKFAYAPDLFTRDPALRLDLPEANRRQLLAAGLRDQAIFMSRACTSCETHRFFSHRAEQGSTGRMLAVIGIREG